MKRFFCILSLIIGTWTGIYAQQSAHYTQYMLNDFVINPAIAGVNDFYQVRTNHRFQWVGLTDPPLTNTISVYGPHAKLPMGFGGYLYSDVTGPTSRTGITGSYAYNIEINRDIRLSMGLSIGMMQYKLDGTQLNIKDNSDLAIQPVVNSTYVPDAGIGFYAYADEWYAGFSVSQLLNNKLKIFDVKNGLNKLKSHFYLTGGYKYEMNRDITIEPSLIPKGTAPKMYQFDLSIRVIYKEMMWGGLSYRLKDAISVMIGYIHDEMIYFGYAYDIGVTSLRNYNSGTHEIMIGYRFNDVR